MNSVSQIDAYASRARFDVALMSRDPVSALDDLEKMGHLCVFPELEAIVGFGGGDSGHKDLWHHTRRVVAQCPLSLTVRWAALFHDVGKPVVFRAAGSKVMFHGHEAASVRLFASARARTGMFDAEGDDIEVLLEFLGRAESYSADWEDSAVRRLSRDIGPLWDDLIALTRADCTTGRPEKREHVQVLARELDERRNRLAEEDAVPPALPKGLGDALMVRYGRPGDKWLGDAMAVLKARVEAGELPRNAPFDVYLSAADELCQA